MATITKRGESWRVQVRRRGHKPITKTFSKKALADKWAREMETEVEAGSFRAEDPTLASLIQRYLDEVEPVKNLQRSHKATLRTLKRKVAQVKVSGIDANWMVEFAKGETCAPSTRSQLFHFIGMTLRTAETLWDAHPDWDKWRKGIGIMKHYGLIGRPQERDQRVSDDVIADILDNMRSELPMDELIGFAVASAMRLGEIVRVQWSDLDTSKKLLTIRDRKHPTMKTGNHQTIPLLGDAMSIVERQVKQAKEIFPYNPNSISAAWHRAVTKAGYEDIRWHDLRHEGICRLFEAGYEIQEVALVSGHRDWNMLRRYTHLKPESLHRE